MKLLVVTDQLDYVGGGFEPLGVMYIIAMLRRAGHEVHLVDNNLKWASEIIDDWKPEVVSYGVYTGYHKQLIEFNRILKKARRFLSIFGGSHPTFFPEMIEEDGVSSAGGRVRRR